MSAPTNLPALPTSSDRSADIGVIVEPVREIVEVRTEHERAVYIVEPVVASTAIVPSVLADLSDVDDAEPANGQVLTFATSTGRWTPSAPPAGGGLVGFAETLPITTPVGQAGISGGWTAAPSTWRLAVPAMVGDILEWAPSLLLGGGPAALDLVCLRNGFPFRYFSSGSSTPSALGSMYSQGDFGTVRLPVLKWAVQADEILNGEITLSLAYRMAGDDDEPMTLGHTDVGSRLALTNFGPIGGRSVAGGGAPLNAITWGDLGTPGAPAPTDPDTGIIPPEYVEASQETVLYLGYGDPSVAPGNYKRVHNVAIDVSTLDIYELPDGAPEGMQEG